jgi:ataxia telangiectasia mutated family protein
MLSLGNIMVVSSAVRRGPYWHLLETCLHSQQYSDHIESILTGVSARLGMASLSMLFEAYASQIAYSISQSKGDFTGVPPHLLGYRDRRQSAEATFRLFTPTNILTNAQQAFQRHCQLLQKSPVDGLRECFGNIVGLLIVSWMLDRPDRSDGEIVHLIKGVMDLGDFQSTLEENVDAIVTTILRSLGDQDFSINGPIILALQAFDETNKIAPTFQALNLYRTANDNFACHIPNLPAFPTQNTLKSLHWLSSTIPSAYTKATTYHVLQQLMREIYTTPLVNEQYRLINAMTLWMAYRRHDFDDVTLLHTVVHGASLLLSQYDLARSAQSILEWAFRCYRKNKLKDSRLPDVLIRICYIAHGFASDTRDRSTSQMGATLLIWIENQVDSLSAVMEASILRALTVWPQAPSEKLMPIYKQITTQTLTAVLEDHRITSNKFRLVRQIQDHTRFERNAQSQFSKFYFWRLKDCIPLPGHLQHEDVQSFTTLLAQNYGKIGSFNVEQPDLNAPQPRHRRVFKKNHSILDSSAARDAISLGIFFMLEDDDPSHVSNAYQTLRLLTSVSSPDHQLFHLPSDYHAELELLKIYRCLSMTRPVVNIHDMLKSDLYLESAINFSKWISLITVLLSDTLATIDPYFGQLSSLLISDIEFADQILPILVHTLLLHNSKKAGPHSYRTTLSEYFTMLLSSKNTDLSCIRVVVDVVLHLRYFNPRPGDALAYNKWLEVDFALLARAAILCGAYTTALLFVETAMEQKSSQGEDSTTEEVLFEIYAHIDEPDGFYGIETKDLHKFLVKRLHHEKQWDKAFRFHGAALEAGRARTGEGDGLLQSFHSFGFDHLAIDTLRNSAGQSRDSHTTSSMDYRLGWRTETWDLPDRAKESSSAPLYRSLKAVYRERDPRIMEDTIRSSLFEEMERLQSLGTENLVEIRSVSQDLMCLGEVLSWMRQDRQDLLKPDNVSLENWKPFINLSEQFE